jgi:S-DNA-T family DNA segregation ATPase FtsK/SpoIIIE
MGADKLLGNGDMLFLWPGTSTLIRGQGTYLSDDEINSVIASVATTEPDFVTELVQLKTTDETAAAADASKTNHRDDLYEAAVEIVIREGRGSVSLLQRALGIGYGRAARLVDYMAEDGIVGNYNGSQAREVMITLEQWAEMCAGGQAGGQNAPATAAAATVEPPRRPGGEILLAAPERRSPRVPLAGPASAIAEDDGPRPSVALRNDDEDLEEEDAYDDEEEEDDEDEADDEDEFGEEDDDEEEDEELDDDAVDFAEAPFDDGDAEAFDEEEGHPAGAFHGEEEDDGPGDAPHRATPRPRRRAGGG